MIDPYWPEMMVQPGTGREAVSGACIAHYCSLVDSSNEQKTERVKNSFQDVTLNRNIIKSREFPALRGMHSRILVCT